MSGRFAAFSDEELKGLYEAIVFDDGIRYQPAEGSVEARLAYEIETEARTRGLLLTPY